MMEPSTIKILPIDSYHADEMQLLAADKLIAETTTLIHPYPVEGAIKFITETIEKRIKREEYVFAILNNQDKFIGTCALLECNFANKTAMLGYWIGKPFWGNGYATSAAILVIEFGFNTLNLKSLFATCLSDNKASINVLKKCEFILKGESKLLLAKWDEPRMMSDFELKAP